MSAWRICKYRTHGGRAAVVGLGGGQDTAGPPLLPLCMDPGSLDLCGILFESGLEIPSCSEKNKCWCISFCGSAWGHTASEPKPCDWSLHRHQSFRQSYTLPSDPLGKIGFILSLFLIAFAEAHFCTMFLIISSCIFLVTFSGVQSKCKVY